jgi:hypothetical protein
MDWSKADGWYYRVEFPNGTTACLTQTGLVSGAYECGWPK